MANQQTGNYQLSQWERTDRIQMEDFNHDNAKIDTALKTLDTALKSKADTSDITALQAQIANCGNCKLVTGSYTGTGKSGSGSKNTLTFDASPIFIAVSGNDRYFFAVRSSPRTRSNDVSGTYDVPLTLTWGERSVSWYASEAEYQCNSNGVTYYYTALLPC